MLHTLAKRSRKAGPTGDMGNSQSTDVWDFMNAEIAKKTKQAENVQSRRPYPLFSVFLPTANFFGKILKIIYQKDLNTNQKPLILNVFPE